MNKKECIDTPFGFLEVVRKTFLIGVLKGIRPDVNEILEIKKKSDLDNFLIFYDFECPLECYDKNWACFKKRKVFFRIVYKTEQEISASRKPWKI